MSLKEEIISIATSHGASLVGIARADVYGDYLKEVRARLQETGATGQDYMTPGDAEPFFERLSDVRRTLASAKSIILVGAYSFDTEGDAKGAGQGLLGKTARTYAYYPVVRQIAEQVAVGLREAGQRAVQGQDVPLKVVANAIGLGSYGWNGLLFTREFGSYVALRAVVTDADLEPDGFEPPALACGDCERCLRACPTGALYAPYKVNPRLCINPLSRRKEDIPRPLRPKMGRWVCGCDICQEVCPMNRGLTPREPDPRAGFDPRHHASHRTLDGLTRCPDLGALVGGSNGPEMQRNAAIALANSGTPEALEVLRQASDMELGALRPIVTWALDCVAKRMPHSEPPDTGG